MPTGYHPLVRRLLDGELPLAELPPELRAEGAEALRLVGAVDRAPAALSPGLDERVMAAVRRHAASPAHRACRWLNSPRNVDLRLRERPGTGWPGPSPPPAPSPPFSGAPPPRPLRGPGTQPR